MTLGSHDLKKWGTAMLMAIVPLLSMSVLTGCQPVERMVDPMERTIGEDRLMARSLGHFDETEYERQLNVGAEAD